MDILTICPQDHKNIIYRYLDVYDLIQLGITSKKLYLDANRKKELVEKLVDEYVYCRVYDTPLIDSEYFCPQNYYNELVQEYFDRIKTISFSDLQLTAPKVVEIQKRHSVSRFHFRSHLDEFGIVVPFTFFVHSFVKLQVDIKHQIIDRIFQYLLDLWRYAEKSQKCIYNTTKLCPDQGENDGFEFSKLFLSLNQILTDIFLEEKDLSIKQFIVDYFHKIRKTTSESKYYVWIDETEGEEDVEESKCRYFSNDYNLYHFIRTLKLCPTEIEKIVDVGLFLLKQSDHVSTGYPGYTFGLATFIAEVFDSFIEGEEEKMDFVDTGSKNENLDSLSEIIHYKLLVPFNQEKLYDNVLHELFIKSNFNYYKFKNVLESRYNRWMSK